LGTQHALEFGAEATQNQIDYHFNFRDDIALFDQSSHGGYYAFYLQDTWHPFPKLSLTSGIRGTYFDGSSRFYGDPRLSIIYHWTDRLRLKGAGGIYHQFVNRLVREDPLQGDQDFWMLSDEDLVPVGSSTHVIGGGSYETDSFLFDVETYWKDLEGLSEFAAFRWGRGRNPADVDLSDRFYSGTGKAKGVEFLAQKKFGQNTGWITYTLGSVDHMFPDISTNFYPASHDSTHEFKIVDSHTWKNFTFSGNWVFASGKPFTEPQGVEEIVLPNERIVELVTLGEKNTSRLPSYHRLDLSATWHFWMGETNKANAGVSIFNAYNNKNVWRKEYDVYEGELIETDVNYLGLTISAFLNVDLSVPSLSQLAGPISSKKSSSKDQESEKKKKKEKIYDFKGTIESIGTNELKINTKWGPKTLIIDDATIKGAPGYDPGTPVHVYYVSRGDQFIVTMVVRVIE
jgi:hypothetical protein